MVPGRWQPSGGEGSGSGSCSAWLANSSSRTEASKTDLLQQQHHHHPATSQQQSQQQQQQQQQALNALSSLNPEQLTIMHQKLQTNLQSLQQKQTSEQQLNLMLQSCAKKKMEELALLNPFQHQMQDPSNSSLQGKPKCPECGKIYSNNSNLKQHIVNVHTVQTQYISCHVCGKQFKTKQYLQIHLLSMHGIRKRKSYPVYQAQPQQQQPFPSANQTPQQQQLSPFSNSERWGNEEKQPQQ